MLSLDRNGNFIKVNPEVARDLVKQSIEESKEFVADQEKIREKIARMILPQKESGMDADYHSASCVRAVDTYINNNMYQFCKFNRKIR
jgi:hypothetical protein